MSTGCHKDRTDRQKDFSAQLSKQKLFRMSTGCQKDRKTGQQRDRKTGRKTEILFSLVIKTKVVKNVNKKDKDRKSSSQNSRAAKDLALVFTSLSPIPVTLSSKINSRTPIVNV